ncbi:hypothetical protein HanRHA438_Chr11g0518641 [Helianthus annuus]|nr:hypothetical protein HanRHA438_Chr11g0518641 [Helianthus annuus]
MLKLSKMHGESSGNNDSSEHDSSSDEDVSTSAEDVTTSSSSSSEDRSECESTREVVDPEANESTSESDSSQVYILDLTDPFAWTCSRCDA